MRKVLFISHGKLALGALSTLSIFSGDTDNITTICAYLSEDDPDYVADVPAAVEKFFEDAGDDQVLVFSDIVFGSVNQLVLPHLGRPNTYVYSGFNLPMLLQMTTLPEDADPETFANLAYEGKEGVVYMNDYSFGQNADEDDE